MWRMLPSLRESLRKRGLTLHPSKCKLQTNAVNLTRRGDVQVEAGFSVEVLSEGDLLKLLGTELSLQDVTGTEIRNRVATG